MSGGRLGRWWAALRPTVISERVLVQLAAVVAGAAFAACAAVLYSNASGTWQQAVRKETQRTAARQEQVRTVYGDEAPVAFAAAAAQVRADDTLPGRQAGSRDPSTPWPRRRHRACPERAAAIPGRRDASMPCPAAGSKHRAGSPISRAPVRATRRRRDRDGRRRTGHGGGVGRAVHRPHHRVAVAGAAMPRRGTAHDADLRRSSAAGPRRGPTPSCRDPALALWAAGVLLPFAEPRCPPRSSGPRPQAPAWPCNSPAEIAIGLTRSEFETNALRAAVFADVAATSRELAALDASARDAAAERALASAEETAAGTARGIAATIGRVPPSVDGPTPVRSPTSARGQMTGPRPCGGRTTMLTGRTSTAAYRTTRWRPSPRSSH